jgi:hypothetical protein
MTRKRKIALAIGVVALGVAATLTYAVLPTTNVDPGTVPIGTLSGATFLKTFFQPFEGTLFITKSRTRFRHQHRLYLSAVRWSAFKIRIYQQLNRRRTSH